MKLESEDDVKRALEITSWRNLSKDKVLRFAALMPDMDKEVALKIIEQLPVFTEFASGALGAIEKAQQSSLTFNKDSQDRVHDAFEDYRNILKGELQRDDLTAEQRRELIDAAKEAVDKEAAKDSENKRFIDGLVTKVAVGAGAAVLAAIVFAGGKVLLERDDERDDASET